MFFFSIFESEVRAEEVAQSVLMTSELSWRGSQTCDQPTTKLQSSDTWSQMSKFLNNGTKQ